MTIIHIVENLDKGAVENWLVNIFIESRKQRPEWEWTFYCILGREGRLDEKVKQAGGKIIYSPVTVSNKKSFLRNLRQVLKTGRYDIIHAHHDYLSGFYLLASSGIKFKKRILQIHNTDKALPVGNKFLHNLLLRPFRKLATHFSDKVVGISENTLTEFVGNNKLKHHKNTLLYYGVDLNRFNGEPERAAIRASFNLPVDSKILLYAGRMNDLKNPVFVVDVLKHLLTKRNDIFAVFIGKGDLEKDVKEKADALGVTSNIRIAGWNENVSLVMKSSDIFIFPRKEYPKEGLGLVVVEAQAAGLPMFITKGIVSDAIVIPELAHFNTLSNAAEWAEHIDSVLNSPPAISRQESLNIMKRSRFELSIAAKNLVDLYEQ